MPNSMDHADRCRLEWCVSTLRDMADAGRAQLGIHYPRVVQVLGTLKRMMEPNIEPSDTQILDWLEKDKG